MSTHDEPRFAIVTGSARGLGLAVATLLSQQGVHVSMVDLELERLASAAEGSRARRT